MSLIANKSIKANNSNVLAVFLGCTFMLQVVCHWHYRTKGGKWQLLPSSVLW